MVGITWIPQVQFGGQLTVVVIDSAVPTLTITWVVKPMLAIVPLRTKNC